MISLRHKQCVATNPDKRVSGRSYNNECQRTYVVDDEQKAQAGKHIVRGKVCCVQPQLQSHFSFFSIWTIPRQSAEF
jgi:hypothetical protein